MNDVGAKINSEHTFNVVKIWILEAVNVAKVLAPACSLNGCYQDLVLFDFRSFVYEGYSRRGSVHVPSN